MIIHSAVYLDLRHDFFRVCAFSTICRLVNNFLPKVQQIKPKWRRTYLIFIDLVAGFALSWRTQQPSLDQEFMGFRRTVRHGYRNWRQSNMDRRRR